MARKVHKKKLASAKKGTVKRLARPSRALSGSRSGSGTGVSEAVSVPKGEPFFLPCPSLRRVSVESLPRMTAVLSCCDEDGGARALGGEDLDALQLELETLLSSVAVRLRQFKSQLSVLEVHPQGAGRRQKTIRTVILAPASSEPTGSAESEEKSPAPPSVGTPVEKPGNAPNKKLSTGFTPPPRKRSKLIRKRPDVDVALKPPCQSKQIDKDVTSCKFWSFLDPYCGDVTDEILNILHSMLSHNESEVLTHLEIPPLGEHFASDWELKDLVENVDVGCPSPSISVASSPSTPTSVSTPSISESIGGVVKRKLRECSVAVKRSLLSSIEKTPTPSTSRLMAALLGGSTLSPLQESKDSNVIIKTEKEDEEKLSRPSRPNSVSSTSTVSDTPRKHQKKCLERKVCLEKEAQGEVDWFDVDSTSDSLFEELKRAQADLKKLTEHNICSIRSLTNILVEEFKVQNLKSRLKEVDQTIISVYQARTAAKLAKQPISQTDVEMAWKALKERDRIVRHLDFFERKWILQG